MVRTESGWSCPQCGSAIIDKPAEPNVRRREPQSEASASKREWVVLSA
jgi:hypothetical protein